MIFDTVNNFGIRHLNERQHTEYDENIWLSWMFHYLMATIHAGTPFHRGGRALTHIESPLDTRKRCVDHLF